MTEMCAIPVPEDCHVVTMIGHVLQAKVAPRGWHEWIDDQAAVGPRTQTEQTGENVIDKRRMVVIFTVALCVVDPGIFIWPVSFCDVWLPIFGMHRSILLD